MATASKHRLLIVDDEPTAVKYVARALETKGLRTAIVGSGREAIAFYEKERPDFVLLDLHLPKMTGLEVLERLKKVDADASVYMVTAEASASCREKAQSLGAAGYIQKPFDAGMLYELAERFLAGDAGKI